MFLTRPWPAVYSSDLTDVGYDASHDIDNFIDRVFSATRVKLVERCRRCPVSFFQCKVMLRVVPQKVLGLIVAPPGIWQGTGVIVFVFYLIQEERDE
jgi:hypothetical protein